MVRPGARSGFSLLEVLIALALLGLMMGSVGLVLNKSRDTMRSSSSVTGIEDLGRRTLARIVEELRDAGMVTLTPTPAPPFSTSGVTFQKNVGMAAGNPVWSDPIEIRLDVPTGRVLWTENPGLPDERQVAICSGVTNYLQGEVANNADDNGNGLEDERGLCFTVRDGLVEVRLTLSEVGPNNTPIVRTLETQVFPRN